MNSFAMINSDAVEFNFDSDEWLDAANIEIEAAILAGGLQDNFSAQREPPKAQPPNHTIVHETLMLTLEEAARRIGGNTKKEALRRAAHDGTLRASRVAGRILTDDSAIRDYLAAKAIVPQKVREPACPDTPKPRAYGSASNPAATQLTSLSTENARSAQDAALKAVATLKASSQHTAPNATSRRGRRI